MKFDTPNELFFLRNCFIQLHFFVHFFYLFVLCPLASFPTELIWNYMALIERISQNESGQRFEPATFRIQVRMVTAWVNLFGFFHYKITPIEQAQCMNHCFELLFKSSFKVWDILPVTARGMLCSKTVILSCRSCGHSWYWNTNNLIFQTSHVQACGNVKGVEIANIKHEASRFLWNRRALAQPSAAFSVWMDSNVPHYKAFQTHTLYLCW
jgi:hypothetical protein